MAKLFVKAMFCALLVLGLSAPSAWAGPIVITVFASSAPNNFGSPSFSGYNTNAQAGIRAGGVATGDQSLPTGYSSGTVFGPGDVIVTDYNSWKGVASPGAPFSSELGNRLHFGLDITDLGGQFSLSQLNFEITSTDANALGYAGIFDSTDYYSATRQGITYGADGVRGGGDDTIITSGSATQLINELVYVGVGNAYCSGAPDDCGGGSFQSIAAISQYIAQNGPIGVTGKYWLTNADGGIIATGSRTVAINAPVPEPATLTLLGLGLAGIARAARRRKK